MQYIQLLEYPIPARPAHLSQKPSSADISETESGIIDPLVSKRPIIALLRGSHDLSASHL